MTNARAGARAEVPSPAPGVVDRPRLLDRIDELIASGSRLVLVSGPAGSGATTVVQQWCSQRAHAPVTWLDVSPWARPATGEIVAAVAAAAGIELPPTFDASPPGGQSFGPAWSSALAAELEGARPGVLVLDGWRTGGPVPLLTELGEALGSLAHSPLVVLATGRLAPAAGFARLRLRGVAGHLDELDLAVDATEVAAIAAARGLDVDDLTIRRICDEVEGWMAGAVMVLDARLGHESLPHAVDRGFESIAEYLSTEVVARLDDRSRDLLLTTACLPVLDPVLCDRISATKGSGRVLEQLRHARSFVETHPGGTPGRPRYRLHGTLRAKLRRRNELRGFDEQPVLRAAANWYIERGELLAAAECLRDLNDLDGWRALMEVHAPALLGGPDPEAISAFAATLPRSFLQLHSEHALATAFVHLTAGKSAEALDLLRALGPTFDEGGAALASLLQASAFAFDADMSPFVAAADATLERLGHLPEDHPFPDLSGPAPAEHYRIQARSAGLLASAWDLRWDRVDHYDPAADHAVAAGEMPAAAQVRSLGPIACALALVGRLREAGDLASTALISVPAHDQWADATTDYAHWAMAAVLLGRLDMDAAWAALDRCEERARLANRRNLLASTVALRAHLLVARGAPVPALQLLDEHHRLAAQPCPPAIRGLLASAEARVRIATGQLDRAGEALADAPATPWTRSAQVGVALAAGDRKAARAAIDSWPTESTLVAGIRRDLAFAAVHASEGTHRSAGQHLSRAARAAGPELLAHPFVEVAAQLIALLRRLAAQQSDAGAASVASAALRFAESSEPQLEPLTAKETLVMHHLARGITLQEVADRLVLSPNTVKTHVKAIYRKLDATSRASAIDRWRSSSQPPET